VDFISWQETLGTVSVFTIGDQQLAGGAFDGFCQMPALTDNGKPMLVGKFGSMRFDVPLVQGNTYDQDDSQGINTFVFAEYDGGVLKVVDSPIINEEEEVGGNFFDCKDVNNDSYPDLVYYAFTRPGFDERTEHKGKPIVYLNDGQGQLVNRDLSELPGHTSGNELQSQLVDVDGDGIMDIMLYGSATDRDGGNFEIHLLSRDL
jgi:hypothetical protein